MSKFMNPSNVYWQPPQYTQAFDTPLSRTTGFLMNIPYPDPVSATVTFGEGSENIYGKREIITSSLPELYAVGDVLPTTGGYPRIDPNGFAARHSRELHTIKI